MWDRGDLLRRLQSYKANTWFCKPPGAGPLDCARRGWVNTALDVLTCEVRPCPPDMACKAHPGVTGPAMASPEALQDGTATGASRQQGVTHMLHALGTHTRTLPAQFCAAKLHLPLPPSLSAEDIAQVSATPLASPPAIFGHYSDLSACLRDT